MADQEFPAGSRVFYKSILAATWQGPALVLDAYRKEIPAYGEDMLTDHWKIRHDLTGQELKLNQVCYDVRRASLLEAIAFAACEPGEG
jgi:hypothetical protein